MIVKDGRMEIELGACGPAVHAAERAVLGCLLIDSRLMFCVKELRLRQHHFSDARHRSIFAVMDARYDTRAHFDLVSVTYDAEVSGMLRDCGGAAYIAGCMDNVPDVEAVEEYVEIVKDASLLRRMTAGKEARR